MNKTVTHTKKTINKTKITKKKQVQTQKNLCDLFQTSTQNFNLFDFLLKERIKSTAMPASAPQHGFVVEDQN